MSYELTLHIRDGSTAEHHIEAVAQAEHVSREEAALRLIEAAHPHGDAKASPEALAILGSFSAPQDAALMDDILEMAMSDRQRHNAELPRV